MIEELKVHRDPRYDLGVHPYHEARFIVTEDCALIEGSRDYSWEPASVAADTGSIIATMTDHPEQAEYARLFAAAPKLLEALEAAVEAIWLAGDRFNDHKAAVTDAARAAIAKAKGGES